MFDMKDKMNENDVVVGNQLDNGWRLDNRASILAINARDTLLRDVVDRSKHCGSETLN